MSSFRAMPSRRDVSLTLVLTLAALPAIEVSADSYRRHDLVSDGSASADFTDPNLVNAWGVAFNPTGAVWVSDNGTGRSTLYDGTGKPLSLVVEIPSPGNSGGGKPTGIVYNGGMGFAVTNGTVSGPSRFIFATEDGIIAGWAPSVDGTHARVAVDNSATTGAIYKGLALSAGGDGGLLYASDFHNGRIDVFDDHFKPVATLPPGAFVDRRIPAGFAPFGLQAINGNIYVTYAKQDADREDDVQGPGLGYLDVYDPNGRLIDRLVSRGALNAPWGMALAPAGFGRLANRLLVGNFGDGRINAYDLATGWFLGQLRGPDYRPLAIDGLWGIAFGNGYDEQPVNTLFYAAGPDDEAHGVYGRIDVVDDHGGHRPW